MHLSRVRALRVFDALFVRDPPGVGPFVSVLGLGAASLALTALEDGLASVQSDLATKRAVSDSYSQPQVDGLLATQAATRYTKVEADSLFCT